MADDEKKIERGAVVKLRSGGRMMTVEKNFCGDVLCVWISDTGQPQTATYRETSLKVEFAASSDPQIAAS